MLKGNMVDICKGVGSFDMRKRKPIAKMPSPRAALVVDCEAVPPGHGSQYQLAVPVKAKPIHLDKNTNLDEVIGSVLRNSLEQFTANWTAFRETDHPEAIHQLRVALRRLRSALRIFERVLPCPGFRHLRAEAKRLALILGPAREYGVLLSSIAEILPTGSLGSFDFGPLLKMLEAKRLSTYKIAREQFDGRSAANFIASLQSLLASRSWNCSTSKYGENSLARDLARDALVRLHKRVLKRGADMPHISDEARHKLRIALKNMHYGIDFFGHMFKHPRKKKHYLDCVAELQSQLGRFNDMLTAKKILEYLSTLEQAAVVKNSQFLLGWFACETAAANARHDKSWTAFKRAEVFWE
jgi:triphosphatase